ncbi:MAG: chromosome segregation protein SMC [Sneathiellaceae bacterium]
MHFDRLRLRGFKSFVEETDFSISPGLTGIVGPNGCGKSNLVEALRWVMGEHSARQMRSGAMDDVIFAGTSTRPPRNFAEVVVTLNNGDRTAPPAYNDSPLLEISRRIDRDSGSTYRINGREVRARDVQFLFADIASGAHSTAIVSQGRIGQLISAKPTDRRRILEEAAGITGLHGRRHESELRLKAAEQNLERVDDVIGELENRLGGLRRQSKQARKYRRLSERIREAEALLLHARWTAAQDDAARLQTGLAAAEQAVADLTQAAATAVNAAEQAEEALPPLRSGEAEAAARLQRLDAAREGLDREEAQLTASRNAIAARLADLERDARRLGEQRQEAGQVTGRLQAEQAGLAEAQAGEGAQLEAAEAARSAAQAEADRSQAELDRSGAEQAQQQAERRRLEQSLRGLGDETAGLARRQDGIARARSELKTGEADEQIAALGEALGQSEARLDAAREELRGGEETQAAAQQQVAEARERRDERRTALNRVKAEEDGLGRLLKVAGDDLWAPLIDRVQVKPGFEKALGAALGEDISASTDTAAPLHWTELPPFAGAASLPAGARPLSDMVTAPPVLQRRLSQIGIVEEQDGAALQKQLAAGQRLVSAAGGLWRWDGYTVAAQAPTAAMVRLEQRNRLAELRKEREALASGLDALEATLSEAQAAAEQARARLAAARSAVADSERAVKEQQGRHARALKESADLARQQAALEAQADQIGQRLAELQRREAEDRAALEALPPADRVMQAAEAARAAATTARAALAEAVRRHDLLRQEANTRNARLQTIRTELQGWTARDRQHGEHEAELGRRRQEMEAEAARLSALPEQIAGKRSALLDQIAGAEQARKAAADALAEATNALEQARRFARERETAVNAAREDRVRLQAAQEHAHENLAETAARIRETFACPPNRLLDHVGLADREGPDLPDHDSLEQVLEEAKRDRERLGPVNLRAEIESQEVEEQIATLTSEKDDLTAAIGRLRQGIGTLNREGRQRLTEAFQQVDAHFQTLFRKVFGGGKAHLALTGSDDPLEAGLEIMASPPGKKMQTMTLLSGGEQALTALALLFAVFRTNPAPICLLDEVDAPLDDANVERMCDLLTEMVRTHGHTRFVIVTHNPISMSRMDRLYGVTMAERGVSSLVSVDLNLAAQMAAE